MATPTNPSLPILSTRVSEHRFGPRAKQIGVRLYAAAWFATAGVSAGLGAYGSLATFSVYHQEVARSLAAARYEWTQKALPVTADPPDPAHPDYAPTYVKLQTDQQWFVDLERRKALGYPPTAEEQAHRRVLGSRPPVHAGHFGRLRGAGGPCCGRTVPRRHSFGPTLLLSLLRWIVTGRRGVGFRW